MNIPENSGDVLKYSESFAAHEDFIDARRDIELTIQKNFVGEEQEKLREYLDLDTLSERMQGRKSVSLKTNQEDGSIVVHTILPITRDEEGNLTEILAGVYKMKQGETLK